MGYMLQYFARKWTAFLYLQSIFLIRNEAHFAAVKYQTIGKVKK